MISTLLRTDLLCVVDYRCEAQLGAQPHPEFHRSHSLSFVRSGSFGCRSRGQEFELVEGAFFVGAPEIPYTCTHEYTCGDECLSIQPTLELLDFLPTIAGWRLTHLPPLAALMPFGGLLQSSASGAAPVSVEESAVLLLEKFASVTHRVSEMGRSPSVSERGRIVRVAQWISSHRVENTSLAEMARKAGMSPFHFLRVFTKVVGATPHQYLLRLRLSHAAELLSQRQMAITDIAYEVGFADLSNFVRTFRKATGKTPSAFQKLASPSNFLQVSTAP